MSTHAKLLAAIQRFGDWNHPWLFDSSTSESLDDSDSRLFAEVWAEAVDPEHWLGASDLAKGADVAAAALSRRFPWLPPEAVKALANAAAYQGR